MFGDLIRETSATTGTADFALSGATAGYRSFSAVIGAGKLAHYRARLLTDSTQWEEGIGVVSAGGLTRQIILASSNGGALVSFSAGVKEIVCPATSNALLARVAAKTAAYTATAADLAAVLTCSGTWTLSLPAAAALGNGWYLQVKNTGSGIITVDPNGSETVDGAATLALGAGEAAFLVCTGAGFVSVKGGGGSLTSLPLGNASAPAIGWGGDTGFFQWSASGVSLSLGGKEILRSYSNGNPGGTSAGNNHYLRIGDLSGSAVSTFSLSSSPGDQPYILRLSSGNGLRFGVESTSPYIDLIPPSLAYSAGVYFVYGGQMYSGIGFGGAWGATVQARTADYSFTCTWGRVGTVKAYYPGSDNDISLGVSTFRWATIYAGSSTIATSDARLKTDIADSDLGLDFIRALRPVRYRMAPTPAQVGEDGEEIAPAQTHTRPHYGLLAQDVKGVLDRAGIDFAGYIDPAATGDTGPLGLRYEEFIAPMIAATQQLAERLVALEARLAELEAG